MTRLEILTETIQKVTKVNDLYIDFTIKGELMIDHEGTESKAILDYFKSIKLISVEYDTEDNRTFYLFSE